MESTSGGDRNSKAGPPAATLMGQILAELARLRSAAEAAAADVAGIRERYKTRADAAEEQDRNRANAFAPTNAGETIAATLQATFGAPPPRADPAQPVGSLDSAASEWQALLLAMPGRVKALHDDWEAWHRKAFSRKKNKPQVPAKVWEDLARMQQLHRAAPGLRTDYMAAGRRLRSHLRGQMEQEVAARTDALQQLLAEGRNAVRRLEGRIDGPGLAWSRPEWKERGLGTSAHCSLRLGALLPDLPASADLETVSAIIDFPFVAGVALSAAVAQRSAAVSLARSLVLRMLAAAPPGSMRFVFIDPVSLGQSAAEFRHLAEFDEQLVDVKTWTSERDIESRLNELSDHLEVVISTYLRGQFDTIDDYNAHAGEVSEPYRTLVVFDYPEGFSDRAARTLLSLIENGPRCGVHTILVNDPARDGSRDVPTKRLLHSMQRVVWQADGTARLTLPDPVGRVDLALSPDRAPSLAFDALGHPQTVYAEIIDRVGKATRTSQDSAVTLDRLLPVLNRQIASGRQRNLPQLSDGAAPVTAGDSSTWWTGSTAQGACAPIGRAGAQDVASLFFSSTEMAGGGIVVGVPRSGKSTALHAAIVTMCMLYPPDELELYLIDSKHGVEFKVYDALPHAKMVAIRSEREFSVAVLRSLDRKIAERAELMKRRSPGTANLSEFRANTGEKMPRIVLIMDEFHEVFEEDDAIGQEAFRCFSNIARQGPFAGVHVIVASQTLSSMPAMDRSTLQLLPMRVAFMCNDEDADFVMTDQNREVKALSVQGAGILNPLKGEPAHNKPFKGTYIAPDLRSELLEELTAKARSNLIMSVPRVFDGDAHVVRTSAVALPRGTAVAPTIPVGEAFDLDASNDRDGVTLRRSRGSNLLVVGAVDDPDGNADDSLLGVLHSVMGAASAHGLSMTVLDFAGDPDARDGLGVQDAADRLAIPYRRGRQSLHQLADLAAEVARRRDASDYRSPGVVVALHGLHRANELVPADDYWTPSDENMTPQPAVALALLVKDGPDVGVHVVVTVDGLAQFERRVGRDLLAEFDLRIATSSASSGDVTLLTDSYKEAPVGNRQLLFTNRSQARILRLRGYPPFTSASLGHLQGVTP